MISISKAKLMKQIITKNPTQLAKTFLQAPSLKESTSNIPLVQALLQSLSKDETTLVSVRESLNKATWAKSSPSLVKDLRSLVEIMEKDPSLKKLTPAFKKTLTVPNETSRQTLQGRLINSGIFYESNLKHQMLPVKAQKAIKNLENYLPKAPLADNFKKDIQIQVKGLLSQERPSLNSFEKIVKLLDKSLNHAQKQLNKNHPLLLISKNLKVIEENLQKSTSPNIQTISKNLLSSLVKNELNFKNLPQRDQKTMQEVKSILVRLSQAADLKPIMPNYLLEKIPLPSKQKSLYFKPNIANEAKIFTPSQINPKSEFLKQTIDQKLPLELRENFSKHKEDVAFAWISKLEAQAPSDAYKDLQTKLSEAIFKLKEVIKNQDSTALRLPAALKHIGDLGAQIKASLPQIDPKTNAIKDESLNDIKRALLSVEKVTKGAEGNIAKEVNAIASKALSQIDFHQLYSYVNQHSHAYLPYLWDGLQGGAIQFKKESEQIYCKIDLEFEKYKKVEILIALFNRHYISLTAGIEHPELFSRIKDNLKTLRELLSSVGLIPHTITLLPTLKDMSYESFSKEEIFGFDYKA